MIKQVQKKRRNKKPITTVHTKAKLIDYSACVNFTRLVDCIKLFKGLPTELHELCAFILRLYEISCYVIVRGVKDASMSDEELVTGLDKIIAALANVRVARYGELVMYQLTGNNAKWNMITALFTLEIQLFIIRNGVSPLAIENTLRIVSSLKFMVYKDISVENYTQRQLYDTMYVIASRWKSIEYSIELVKLINAFKTRLAYLCIGLHGPDIMDGSKIHKIPHGDTGKFGASLEFISDMAVIITTFEIDISVMNFFESNGTGFQSMGKTLFDYDIESCCYGLISWILEDQLPCLSDGKIKMVLKKTMLSLSLRPGERERYARYRGGIFIQDPLTIMEHCRTAQQVLYWQRRFDGKDIKNIVQRAINGVKDLVYNVLVAKIIDMFWERTSNGAFKWWSMAVLMASDFYVFKDKLLQCTEPIIIQSVGEWNLYYEGTLYITKTIDKAVVIWMIILYKKRQSTYTNYEESWDLSPIRDLLRSWSSYQDDDPEGEDDFLTDMTELEIIEKELEENSNIFIDLNK